MTPPTLQIALQNQTSSAVVYAYITGQAIDNNNALFLLQSDGQSAYYPSSPSKTGTTLAANCSIALGNPGSTRTVTIPRIAGGRVWFSIDNQLTFLLNPGPGLVEPSVTNSSDPNINTNFGFCEFTYNDDQLYANISYVDFTSTPIALTLQNSNGQTQHISGLPQNGLSSLASQLHQQDAIDNAGWSKLIVNGPGGNPLRVLSPNVGIITGLSSFSGYYEPYVNQVWSYYTNNTLKVDTQAQWGTVSGQVSNNKLTFSGAGSFAQPSTADIFSNSSGPFSNLTVEMGAIAARLAAAFNRSTLLVDSVQPDGESPSIYYKNPITNHYSRILHSISLDGKGYGFPYDDVAPNGGADQSGYVSDGSPTLWTIAVGGANATAQGSIATVQKCDATAKEGRPRCNIL